MASVIAMFTYVCASRQDKTRDEKATQDNTGQQKAAHANVRPQKTNTIEHKARQNG